MDSSLPVKTALRKRKFGDLHDDEADSLFVSRDTNDSKINIHALDHQNDSESQIDAGAQDDDSENDGDEEHDTFESKYDEGKEHNPACAAYDPDFEKIQQRLIEMGMQARVVLHSYNSNTVIIQKLRYRADEMVTIPEPRPSIIGFVGEAGAGKSSLLSSITDIPNLAKALDSGHSCTYVATIYHKALPSQKCKFSATIQYFDLETISTILTGCLNDWAIWRYEDRGDWDNETEEQYQRRADTCLATFRAVFCETPDFKDVETGEKCLDAIARDMSDCELQLKVFIDIVRDFLDPKVLHGGEYIDYVEQENVEDLRETIDPLLMESTTYEESSLWPLVKQVNIGVRGSKVLDRHTFVDLPGTSDTNRARVKTTYAHIDQCNEIWIVGRTGRIITDTTVDSLLHRYGKANEGHVAVVVTKSDENAADHDLPGDLRRKGYVVDGYDDLSGRMKNITTEIEQSMREKKKVKPKNARAKLHLQRRIERTLQVHEDLKQQRHQLVVGTRNRYIKEKLQSEKQKHLPTGALLNVFCVSNLHYAAWKNTGDIPKPLLEVTMTGIPEIRKFALKLAAPKLLRAVEDFTKHEFSIYFQGLDLWASSEVVDGRARLLGIIREPEAAIKEICAQFVVLITRAVDEKLNGPLQHQQQNFVKGALAYLKKLKTWPCSTLKAFIKNHGNHETAKKPKQSWNRNFMQGPHEVITRVWPAFVQELREYQEYVERGIVMGMRKVMNNLKGDPAALTLPMPKFEAAMEAHIQGVCNYNRDCIESLVEDLRVIFDKAIEDRPDGYFTQIMQNCYDQCRGDSGTGVKERWMSAFATDLSSSGDRSPFTIMREDIRRAILEAAQNRADILKKGLEGTIQGLSDQFDLMISSKADDSSEIPIREAMQKFMIKARPEFEEIKNDLEGLKRRYGV